MRIPAREQALNNMLFSGLNAVGNTVNKFREQQYAVQTTEYEVAAKNFWNKTMEELNSAPLEYRADTPNGLPENSLVGEVANEVDAGQSVIGKYESWWDQKAEQFYEEVSGKLTNPDAKRGFDLYYQQYKENGRAGLVEMAQSREMAANKVVALDRLNDAVETKDYDGVKSYVNIYEAGGVLTPAEAQQWRAEVEEIELYEGLQMQINGINNRKDVVSLVDNQPIDATMKNQLIGVWDAREAARIKAEAEALKQRREQQMQIGQEMVLKGMVGNVDQLYDMFANDLRDLEASDHRILNSLLSGILKERDKAAAGEDITPDELYEAKLTGLLINPRADRTQYEETLIEGVKAGFIPTDKYLSWKKKADSKDSPHLNRPEIVYAVERIQDAASGDKPLLTEEEALELEKSFYNFIYANSWKEDGLIRDTDVSNEDIKAYVDNQLKPLEIGKIGDLLTKSNFFAKNWDKINIDSAEEFAIAIEEGKVQGLVIPELITKAMNQQSILPEEDIQKIFTRGRDVDSLTDREKKILDVNMKYIDLVRAQGEFIENQIGPYDSVEMDITGIPRFRKGEQEYRIVVRDKKEVIEKYNPVARLWVEYEEPVTALPRPEARSQRQLSEPVVDDSARQSFDLR